MLTPEQVITEFGKLTGIPFRVLPHYVQKQAAVFARNFELWELRVAVEWVKSMIREAEGGQRNGFSKLSLQWKNMMYDDGDESLQTFQSRLGLAMEWAAKHRKDLLPREYRPEPVVAAPVEEFDAHVFAWRADTIRIFKEEMGGLPKASKIIPREETTWEQRKAMAARHGGNAA